MRFKEKSLKGTLIISRMKGRSDNPRVEIRIKDETSLVTFAEVSLTLEQFAEAVTGLSTPDVDLTTRGLSYVGRKRLTRTEIVEFTGRRYSGHTDEEKVELCRPVMRALKKETGLKWTPNVNDLGNSHKSVKGEYGMFRVMFTAYEKKQKHASES